MSVTFAFDVPGFNFSQAPQGFQLCGYDTGSGGVAWMPSMWAAHPGSVHIDQAADTARLQAFLDAEYDPSDTVPANHVTSDVLDVENGAVPVGSPLTAAWARLAIAAFAAGTRPGQRRPVLYQSLSNVTPNVNALIAGGVTSGVGLWIAKWDGNSAADVIALAQASGPFPVIGFQFADDGPFDADVFSTTWLTTVSGGGWVFGPCRNVRIWGGATTTIGISGDSPGTPEPLGVGKYEFSVCEGSQFVTPAAGYPVYQVKNASSSQFSFTGHGLRKGQLYTAGVRAIATDGGHSGPWVTGQVTPGGR